MSDQATIFELPYNLFLMQRMEFVVICGDQLAASIMRVVEAEMIKRKEAWQVRAEKAIEAKKPLPKEPKTWWVQLSQTQIIARLYMYDSAKLKKPESEDLQSPEWVDYRYKKALSISKGTLRKAIDLLENLGFLLERGKPGDEFGAPIWTLHKENVQKALKALPENPFAIFHALGGGSKFEYGGEVQNLNVPPTNFESGDTQNLNVPGSENECGEVQNLNVNIDITIDPLEDTGIDNEEEGTGANAPTPAREEPYVPVFDLPQRQAIQELSPVLDEKIEQVDEERIRIASTPAQGDDHDNSNRGSLLSARSTPRYDDSGSHSHLPGVDGDTHRTASPQQQSGDRVPLAHPAEHAADGGANARTVMGGPGLTSRDHESAQADQRFQADATTGVSAGAGGYEKAGSRAGSSRPRSSQRSVTGEEKQSKRTSKSSSEATKSEPLTMPPEDAPWNTTTCLHLFDFWRGAPLLRKDECMKASHCAKGLAENYTRKQVETVRRWMRERDPYWSQRASSVDVCQVAGQIHRILADIEAARQVKRAASTQAVDPQVAAVRALAQRFSAPAGER